MGRRIVKPKHFMPLVVSGVIFGVGLRTAPLPMAWAQETGTTASEANAPMAKLQENLPLFAILGGLALFSFGAFIFFSRKSGSETQTTEPAPPAQDPPAEGVGPWHPLAGYPQAVSSNEPTEGVTLAITPQGASPMAAVASSAATATPSESAQPPLPTSSIIYHPVPPVTPDTDDALIAETNAPVSDIVINPTPSVDPLSSTPVNPTDFAETPIDSADFNDAGTIFVSPQSERAVEEENTTITILSGFFEVLASANPEKDPVGTSKRLLALSGNPDFGIARPTEGQDQIANFIPIYSKKVSRSSEKQGKVTYDFATGMYTLVNFADPAHPDPKMRCNPMRVEGQALRPGESVVLQDGDRVLIGDIMLRFRVEGEAHSDPGYLRDTNDPHAGMPEVVQSGVPQSMNR